MSGPDPTIVGEDGIRRCAWGSEPEIYREYHDTEWGFGVAEDRRLFEKLCLEGFQAGLSWLTILRKRPAFRTAFADFDPVAVAAFDDSDVERLVTDAGIVRHAGKIRSAIGNAGRALDLIAERGSLAAYFWPAAEFGGPAPVAVPATTESSVALARDLKRRGWTFVGPTTVYAFMQAMGLVNDHLAECGLRDRAETSRRAVAATVV